MLSTKRKEKRIMMLEEFAKLTGFTPDQEYYHAYIEPEYLESDLDKSDWCKQWVKNGGIQKAYNDLNEVCDIYKNSYENAIKEYRSLRDDYDKLLKEQNEALKKIEGLKKSLNIVKEQLDCTQAMYKNLLEDLEMELYK